ncbi:transcriptional regulator [Pasteurellaceae bacterium LFhippo2]|nr:transcriptional regulator [Pasteurellaceae bacterium LFhippo2]
MYKYSKLTNSIKQLIQNGELYPHQKLPSLRDQVQRTGLSLMTVLNAYQELEAQGIIYSIEKSGYFVAPTSAKVEKQINLNTQIEINSLVFDYLQATQSAHIPLGSPFPSNDILNPPKLTQILGQISRNPANYQIQHFSGNPELKKLIAQRYTMQGIPTQADDIVITSGCLDALNLALQALTKPGDYILLQQTIFYGAWQIAEKLGLKVVTIPENSQTGFDLDAFEQAIQQYPIKVCWFMLNCHNPLGFTVSEEIKARIGELLDQYQIYLIEDDVYEELYYRGQKPSSMKTYDKGNWVLHCSSFSKTLGANFRIGWVHAGQFADHIQHLQLMSTISANPLIQKALVEFISNHHYEKHLRKLRRTLEKNKKTFFANLRQSLPACCVIENHQSGYFLWINLPEQVDSMQVYQSLLKENISVSPSALFSVGQSQKNGLRINCSFEWTDEIERSINKVVNTIQTAI